MSRRVNLPGADELFRPTVTDVTHPDERNESPTEPAEDAAPVDSGRVKHDEKMTVYLTADELMAVEQARAQLRVRLGRTVDRGRFVRAALAAALADLETRDLDSDVARRLAP